MTPPPLNFGTQTIVSRGDPLAKRTRRGISLLEVILSMAIVGGLLASTFAAVGVSAQRGYSAAQRTRADWLANDLLNEICGLPCDADAGNALGGVLQSLDLPSLIKITIRGGEREQYDSVFDYVNWASSPPIDRAGDALLGYEGWTRAATVVAIDPTDPATRRASKNAALITVTVRSPDGASATVTAIRTAATDHLRGITTEDAEATGLLGIVGNIID